jgi:hypothetical protein
MNGDCGAHLSPKIVQCQCTTDPAASVNRLADQLILIHDRVIVY